MNQHLENQQVLVLGLGASGLAMARWCVRQGARVTVWDSRDAPPQAEALRAEVPAAVLSTGALTEQALDGMQWLLKSPGLAPGDERLAPLLAAARARGLRVGGELDLFALALADLKAERSYAPQVLAITGTNGKTTTTALTALLVERAGRTVATAGNIGPTMLDTLAHELALERAASEQAGQAEPADGEALHTLPQVWVLELSSFQLHDLETGAQAFAPVAATVLNISQDHLDWHGTLDAYAAAKARIFGAAGTLVINRDDPTVAAMEPAPVIAKLPKGAPKPAPRPMVRFGTDTPARPGDFGLVVTNGMTWLVRALPADETIKRRKGEEEELFLQNLMPADALRVRGRHNAANALAALALATAIDCPLAPMLHALREYRGEPHRVQPVGRVGDVEAFDDSKGTNVGATVAALNGLGQDKAPAKLVVILGGDGKGQDFSPLRAAVASHARAVALIGRDAQTIEGALQDSGVPMQHHATLEQATEWCFERAHAGDAVLLSPACASLDMFRNYTHRAEVFVAAVHSLAAEHGEVLE
jgi:UDP-N-acetylmuramoylalanine--D-glutamate ligase